MPPVVVAPRVGVVWGMVGVVWGVVGVAGMVVGAVGGMMGAAGGMGVGGVVVGVLWVNVSVWPLVCVAVLRVSGVVCAFEVPSNTSVTVDGVVLLVPAV